MTETSSKKINIIHAGSSITAISTALIAASAGGASYIEPLESIHQTTSAISVGAAFITAIAGVITHTTSTIIGNRKDQDLSAASKISAQANTFAIEAKAKTELLEKKNTELSLQLSQEQADRQKIETSLGKRSLSNDQLESLAKEIGPEANIADVIVHISRQEPEVKSYAQQIASAFIALGVPVKINSSHVISAGDNTGVQVLVLDGAGHDIVEHAIRNAGFASKIKKSVTPPPGRSYGFDPSLFAASITVFPKPPHI